MFNFLINAQLYLIQTGEKWPTLSRNLKISKYFMEIMTIKLLLGYMEMHTHKANFKECRI